MLIDVVETNDGDGLRERKKRATRAALSDAALRLCAEHGVQHVTVEQIAEAADVSPRTFFNYFATKEEAIVSGDTTGMERFATLLAERPADEPLSLALRESVRALLAGQDTVYRERIERLRLVLSNPSLLPAHLAGHQAIERALAAVIAQRTGVDADTDLDSTLVAACTVTALRVATKRWLQHEGEDLTELALHAVSRVAAGLERDHELVAG